MTSDVPPGPLEADRDHANYAVISCSGEWRVLTSRRQFGHFHRRASAWAVAVELAKEALASGQAVELYQQGEDADFALNFVYRSPELGADPGADNHAEL